MKAHEIIRSPLTDPTATTSVVTRLDEVTGKPGQLAQLAAATGAIAGIEFEMIVPGADTDDGDDGEWVDIEDVPVRNLEDIENFFGVAHTPAQMDRLMWDLRGQYEEWLIDYTEQSWDSKGREYLEDNYPDEFDEEEARERATEELEAEYEDEQAFQQAVDRRVK